MAVPYSVAKSLRCIAAAIGLLPVVCGCADRVTPVELNFSARYGDHALSCTEAVAGLQLTDLRFFVYDLKLIDRDGRSRPVGLLEDGVWQDRRVGLLDFEDGQGACINGSMERNRSVRGVVAGENDGGSFRGISFTVGVPPDSNHRDPMTAKAPLNYTAMHWHWLHGYKFMRIGVSNESDRFWMHLGSSYCDGSISDGIHCRLSNRVAVTLGDFDPSQDRIVIDVEPLVTAVNLADGIVSDCRPDRTNRHVTPRSCAFGLPLGATPTGRSACSAANGRRENCAAHRCHRAGRSGLARIPV
jgi:uncharacterized repeat protein (TIGR04052 family)